MTVIDGVPRGPVVEPKDEEEGLERGKPLPIVAIIPLLLLAAAYAYAAVVGVSWIVDNFQRHPIF